MTRITVNELQPNTAIKTADPVLEIISEGGTLPVGPHTFRLVVVDSAGNQSAPVDVEVIIVDTQAPTAVLDVLPTSRVEQGSTFTLSAERSVGLVQGETATYFWTLVEIGR
ncbi:MAG: hypothetical protein K8L91_07680 [Anaerolineae bacterium]|nr:hypothetical protein [Anaerolineae bacterium]